MGADVVISQLDGEEARTAILELALVLVDCVDGGASVYFMHPLPLRDAEAFFQGVAGQVAQGEAVLFVARIDGRILGTVQLGLDTPPNQPHRADVKKMLVHRDARRQGVGAALLAAAEKTAAEIGRTLLVLDTVLGAEGERLYTRGGWSRVGVIPDYALLPEGGLCSTVYFYKRVGG